MKKQDKIALSNAAGLGTLIFFVFVVLVVGCTRWGIRRYYFKQTREMLRTVAVGFASHDKDVMDQWARGEFQDPWKNSPVILENDGSVCFVSKGPDGQLDTGDDIVGERITKDKPISKIAAEKVTKVAAEKAKSLMERVLQD